MLDQLDDKFGFLDEFDYDFDFDSNPRQCTLNGAAKKENHLNSDYLFEREKEAEYQADSEVGWVRVYFNSLACHGYCHACESFCKGACVKYGPLKGTYGDRPNLARMRKVIRDHELALRSETSPEYLENAKKLKKKPKKSPKKTKKRRKQGVLAYAKSKGLEKEFYSWNNMKAKARREGIELDPVLLDFDSFMELVGPRLDPEMILQQNNLADPSTVKWISRLENSVNHSKKLDDSDSYVGVQKVKKNGTITFRVAAHDKELGRSVVLSTHKDALEAAKVYDDHVEAKLGFRPNKTEKTLF